MFGAVAVVVGALAVPAVPRGLAARRTRTRSSSASRSPPSAAAASAASGEESSHQSMVFAARRGASWLPRTAYAPAAVQGTISARCPARDLRRSAKGGQPAERRSNRELVRTGLWVVLAIYVTLFAVFNSTK